MARVTLLLVGLALGLAPPPVVVDAALAPPKAADAPVDAKLQQLPTPAILVNEGVTILVVTGDAQWLGAALANLSDSTTVVSLRADARELWDRVVARWPDAVFLLAEDSADALWTTFRGLQLPPLTKTLLWTAAFSLESALDRLALPRLSQNSDWICYVTVGVLVTVPNGTTVVLPSKCEEFKERRQVAERKDILRLQDQPLAVFCKQPDSQGQRNTVNVLLIKVAERRYARAPPIVLELQKMMKNFTWVIEKDLDASEIDFPHLSCKLDLVMMRLSSIATQFNDFDQLPKPFLRLIVVVPTGLGRARPFYGIIGEFSATLWCATGVAVAAVAVATFALARGWRRGHRGSALWNAARTAFAPLLGQAAPETDGQCLLLGVWLLACVVLSAAYTGELLADLTSKQRLDIDSVEELVASELDIVVPWELPKEVLQVFVGTAASRLQYADRHFRQLLNDMAVNRSFALFLPDDVLMDVGPYLVDPPTLHVFYVQTQLLENHYWVRKESPLAEPLRKVFARSDAAGLIGAWMSMRNRERLREIYNDFPELSSKMNFVEGAWERKDTGPRVLILSDLGAAFFVLAMGLCLASLVFCLERWFSCGRASVSVEDMALADASPGLGNEVASPNTSAREETSDRVLRRSRLWSGAGSDSRHRWPRPATPYPRDRQRSPRP